jgi:hypothetical protein
VSASSGAVEYTPMAETAAAPAGGTASGGGSGGGNAAGEFGP